MTDETNMYELLIWLLMYLMLIIGLFYLLYKTLKTKNIKYAYGIGGMLILMIGMFFL